MTDSSSSFQYDPEEKAFRVGRTREEASPSPAPSEVDPLPPPARRARRARPDRSDRGSRFLMVVGALSVVVLLVWFVLLTVHVAPEGAGTDAWGRGVDPQQNQQLIEDLLNQGTP